MLNKDLLSLWSEKHLSVMILVIGKALNILELLSRNTGKEFPLGEIADTLGMDRGTCANIIKTLAARGYVQQTGPRQGYKLGYMVYNLANSAVNNDDLTKIAREDVTWLGNTLNEAAILSVIRNDKRVVLFHTDPDWEVVVKTNIAKSIYSANTGRVILANYSPAHQEKFIIRNGLPTKEEWPEIYLSDNPSGELMNQLAIIRNNGYEIFTDQNDIEGFAAPLFNEGHVIGSVGVYMPIFRVGNKQAVLRKVLDCAEEINQKISDTEDLKHLH